MVNILQLEYGLLQGHNVNTNLRFLTYFSRFLLSFLILINLESYASESLRLISYQNISTGEKFSETEIGGLSGIVYDKNQKRLLAISDDRAFVNDARFYEFNLLMTDKIFSVAPVLVTKLKNKEGKFFKKGYPDFEGITFWGQNILVSSEGGVNRINPIEPELFLFKRNGDYLENFPVPEKFLPSKKLTKRNEVGIRDNKAFETLSTSLDGKLVFMATEEALFQDGPISNINSNSHVRLIIYKEKKPIKEFVYKLEKVEALKAVDLSPGEIGLTDIAVIDENNFYSLERTYLPFQNKNIIKIFKCKITDLSTDVSKMASLINANFISIEKELVADLDDYLPLMNPPRLDNIEGMAFGPELANGNQTLIVVSDNNFGKNQRTLFMGFEILPKK